MSYLEAQWMDYWLDVHEGKYKPKDVDHQAAYRRALRDYMKPPDPYHGNDAFRRAVEQYQREGGVVAW